MLPFNSFNFSLTNHPSIQLLLSRVKLDKTNATCGKKSQHFPFPTLQPPSYTSSHVSIRSNVCVFFPIKFYQIQRSGTRWIGKQLFIYMATLPPWEERKPKNRPGKKCVGVVSPFPTWHRENAKRPGNGKMLNAKRGKFARFPSISGGGTAAVDVICVIRDHPRRKVK